MKIKFLTILVLILLNSILVSAVDVRPTIKFSADSYHVVTEATLRITAYDKYDNAGLLWIKIYENDVLIDEHNCYGLTSCTYKDGLKIIHSNAGSFIYKAVAKDLGDKQSERTYLPAPIIFDGNLPPQISNPQPSPSPPDISAGETINFRVTITDPEGKNLNVIWLVNSVQAKTENLPTGSTSLFSYTFSPPATATYLIQARVSDEWLTSTYSWTVNVIQTDLTGVILDSNNKIYNAKVELLNGPLSYSPVYTLANGLYSFLNIIRGTYNLDIKKPGFTDQLIQLTISLGSNTRNVVLVPAAFSGTITGKVFNGSDGTTPIPNAQVNIIKSTPAETVQIVISDATGNYRINGLLPTSGFTYSLTISPIPSGYTQSFGPSGINLNSGQTLANQNLYLI